MNNMDNIQSLNPLVNDKNYLKKFIMDGERDNKKSNEFLS